MSDDCEHPPDALVDAMGHSARWYTTCTKCGTIINSEEDLP